MTTRSYQELNDFAGEDDGTPSEFFFIISGGIIIESWVVQHTSQCVMEGGFRTQEK
jgi:hypothetical protein